MTFLLVVTIASLLLAAIMSLVAWRIASGERRRSEARVAALAAEIHAAPLRSARVASFAAPRAASRQDEDLPIRPAAHGNSGPTLFEQPQSNRGSSPLAIGSALAFVAVGAAAAFALAGGLPSLRMPGIHAARAGTVDALPQSAAAVNHSGAAPADTPLELVALGHDRDGDRLTVRGIVRNPAGGAALDSLTAVVAVFSAAGEPLTSGRAGVESPSLQPGAESTFVVVVPDAVDVARYRVSFRSADRTVPHVDRRELPRVSS